MRTTLRRMLDALRSDFAVERETITCDIWSGKSQVELRCGFTLRRDHVLRTYILTMSAGDEAETAR